MGILKANRRGTKGAKPPIPVPGCWAERLRVHSQDQDVLDASAESGLLSTLLGCITALAGNSHAAASWLEQSAHLKSAEGALSGLQRLPELSLSTLTFLRSLIIPVFVECYFLPSDVVVRRQAIPLIKTLAALDPSCVDSLLQANLLAFIGAQNQYLDLDLAPNAVDQQASETYARQAAGQRAQALEVLANTPYGYPVIRRFISDVLGYCGNELSSALPRLQTTPAGMSSAEVVQLRDDCTQIARLAFLCLSKLEPSSSDLQLVIFQSMRTPSQDFVSTVLARIYAACWVLVGCDNAALNSRQVAAMVLVQLIEGSGLPPAERAAALARHLLDIETPTSLLTGYLPTNPEALPSWRVCMGDAVAMVCVARGIVSLAPYDTTLCELSVPSGNSATITTVHEAVFTHIASICGRSQLAPGVKVLVFETMATWLHETAQMLQQRLVSTNGDSNQGADQQQSATAFALGQRVLLLQRERIMGYLWSYWDDPLDAVQAKVKAIFDAFLDIGSAMSDALGPTGGERNAFLDDVLDLVLIMDWSRKVKYSLLAALCPRISLLGLFRRQPDLLTSCFDTLAHVTMASRAATLLTALLARAASDDAEAPHVALWVPPVVAALCRDDDSSRRMLAQHVLPALFASLPRAAAAILLALMAHRGAEDLPPSHAARARQLQTLDACRQHALIVVLKAARAQDLITIEQLVHMDSEQQTAGGGGGGSMLVDMLGRAVYHPDWTVRADMLGLLCESRKLSAPLHEVEYQLLFQLLRVSANAPSADFRQQQFGALTVLATRLATVATHAERVATTGHAPVPSQKVRHRERARREAAVARAVADGRSEEDALRGLGVLPPHEAVAQAAATLARVERAVGQWLDLAVRGCLYPGAGFAKVAMGLRWLDILLTHFGGGSKGSTGSAAASASPSTPPFRVAGLGPPDFERLLSSSAKDAPQRQGVAAEEVVSVLTQVLIDDPFDMNRASAFALLTAWPLTPLENSDAPASANSESTSFQKRWANGLLQSALRLVGSTRAGESESGALIIRWLFRKFVVLQGLTLAFPTHHLSVTGQHVSPDLAFAEGLLALIRQARAAAERNLLDAAQRHPLHGLLTATQYVAEEIDFASPGVQQHAAAWRQWLGDLASAAIGVCNVVLGVLTNASPEGNVPASFREMEDKIDAIIRSAADDSQEDPASARYDQGPDDDDDLLLVSGDVELDGPVGPRQQVILSYCWRAIKEVSGLLAAIATRPPGSDQVRNKPGSGHVGSASITNSCCEPLVDEKTVGAIGGLLRTLLTSIRHRGAFSAVHPAFTDVCGRMIRSPSAALNSSVGAWLGQCLDAATICQVSVTRRSAGWPLCLLSVLTCDKLATQALLPRAMDRLFALASDLQINKGDGPEPADGTTDLPQVHAINMLRELLDDHALAADIVPYIEHAYVLSLTGLRSRRWAIRNVCGLLYAALTRRVFGNSKSRDPSKYDGITGRELFTRFPGLHPFLTNQLEDAVDQLADAETLLNANDDQALDPLGVALRSGARCIHPALYPCLILLSRLQPSPMDTNPTTADPAAADLEEHLAGVVAHAPHFESASGAVAPPMLLENEPLTRVNERNSTVHVTSSSAMLSMYSFTELVEMCVDSPVFKTREMAARAFAPLVPGERVVGVVLSLLKGLREAGTRISANTCHGTLCQIHELLRVHWGGSGVESMRRAFVAQIVPDLAALWPVIVQALDRHEPGSPAIQDTENERSSTESCEKADDVSDIVRHRYLLIINEFVARGELWLLPQSAGGTDTGDDAEFSRSARLVLSRFRISMLYGSLHPLFADRMVLRQLGNAQTLGAYGTVLELTRLFLACVDDRTLAVVKADRTVQLCLEENAVSGIGNQKSRVLYNPWTVLASLLACSDYYEAKLAVLEWLADHVARERMEIFARIGITNLLSVLAADAIDTRVDPVVRAASIRLLAQLCAKLEIDPEDFPVNDLAAFWDQISAQLHGTDMFCPLSVALALTELQATLVHMVYARAVSADEANNAHRRLLAWANHLYEWADPEMATPYRSAVSRALVLYSAIKRFHETNPPDTHKQKQTLAVDTASEQILRLCYWRMLQDDDEEIRDFVAQSISRRLGRQLGCDQACERLIADFAPPPGPLSFPLTYVSNRLAYLLALPPAGECTPVSERAARVVDAAVHPSRILFDHEAPNIYIDQSRNTQLAYYSLVSIADYSVSTPEELKVFVDGAMQCVEALDSARMALANTDALSATSRPTLFPLLQSWILGAQLAVFVASKMECTDGGANDVGANGIIPRVSAVADSWLNSAGLQPVHPWIARALRSLADLCACALAAADSPADATLRISKDRAVADLYLLTYI